MGWLAAAVVLLVVSVVVFAGGLRGPAVAVTVADDAVVRWLAGLRAPGLLPAMRALAALGSWVAISALLYGLLAALLILRRLRQLLIVLAAWIMQGVIIQYVVAPLAQRPRPFGVVFRTGWDAWALPSEKMAALVVTLLGILYALVPEGRWRQRGKWAAAAVVLLVAIAHLYLGVLAPTDVLVGVVVGVAIPLAGFRLFAPGEVFPVTYRRGSTAHLDVGGSRGRAIRRALEDPLGLVAGDVEPFGLAGSAGSTPMRLTVAGEPSECDMFAKLYARNHVRSDRWYKLGREILYGRLEDEIEPILDGSQADPVRGLLDPRDARRRMGVPVVATCTALSRSHRNVSTFSSPTSSTAPRRSAIPRSSLDDALIDEGLDEIRTMWNAGVAHRDIKTTNLMVHDGHLVLIDVAFAQIRPGTWREAVDLANMMLVPRPEDPTPKRSTGAPCASSPSRKSPRDSRPPAGLPCPRSCGGCSASKVVTCTANSSGCCPSGPGRSGSSGGARVAPGYCCSSRRWQPCSSRPLSTYWPTIISTRRRSI